MCKRIDAEKQSNPLTTSLLRNCTHRTCDQWARGTKRLSGVDTDPKNRCTWHNIGSIAAYETHQRAWKKVDVESEGGSVGEQVRQATTAALHTSKNHEILLDYTYTSRTDVDEIPEQLAAAK